MSISESRILYDWLGATAKQLGVYRVKLVNLFVLVLSCLLLWLNVPIFDPTLTSRVALAAPLCRTINSRTINSRTINNQQNQPQKICIDTIKRSAKQFWEYRAILEIDGQKTALERYNCRDRLIYKANGNMIPFSQDPSGKLVCTLFDKQHAYR
jgi:hypothetical protein